MSRRDGLFGEAGLGAWRRLGNTPFVLLILLYRVTLSPFIGGQCRFEPTCSRYALTAFRRYGPLSGALLSARRVARCHPFGRGGYDPVPVGRSKDAAAPVDSSVPGANRGRGNGVRAR